MKPNKVNLSSNRIQKLAKLSLPVFILACLTACGGTKKQEAPVFTQLNDVLADSNSTCKEALIEFGNELILEKQHALQLEQASVVDEDGSKSLIDLDNQLILSGLLNFKDRPAHVRFDANQADNSGTGSCVVSYQLDYQLNIPCIAAREEAFKKWNQIGELGDKTRYFVHMRKPNKKVFLTNVNQNQQCLISVKETQVILNK